MTIGLERLLSACADDGFDDGIRFEAELEPLAGPGGQVKPAVYEGGAYQLDRRWASPADAAPTPKVTVNATALTRLEILNVASVIVCKRPAHLPHCGRRQAL